MPSLMRIAQIFVFRILPAALALATTMAVAAGGQPSGVPIFVTRLDDPPPSACTPSDCSLREAIIAANANAGPDKIVVPAGIYRLGIKGRHEDGAATGDLDIADDTAIEGAGEATVLVAFEAGRDSTEDRMFHVLSGARAAISNLVIGGVYYHYPDGVWDCGGGIRNDGTLDLARVRIADVTFRHDGAGICNYGDLIASELTVRDSSAAFAGSGGGLYNAGTATVRASAFFNNQAEVGSGGAIYNTGTLTLVNVTITANYTTGPFGDRFGGGVYNSGQMFMSHVTVSDNSTPTSGGGIFNEAGGMLSIVNSVVALNENGDCVGAVASLGHNIASDRSCGFTAEGDQAGVDPMLGLLAMNGGRTLTRALLPGSPAIDAGDDAACADSDQRGLPRPQDGGRGGRCDIGAYEKGDCGPPICYPLGDADCDLDVDALDALALLRAVVSLPTTAACLRTTDVDCDLATNATDALLILRHAAALAPAAPAGCPPVGLLPS